MEAFISLRESLFDNILVVLLWEPNIVLGRYLVELANIGASEVLFDVLLILPLNFFLGNLNEDSANVSKFWQSILPKFLRMS